MCFYIFILSLYSLVCHFLYSCMIINLVGPILIQRPRTASQGKLLGSVMTSRVMTLIKTNDLEKKTSIYPKFFIKEHANIRMLTNPWSNLQQLPWDDSYQKHSFNIHLKHQTRIIAETWEYYIDCNLPSRDAMKLFLQIFPKITLDIKLAMVL